MAEEKFSDNLMRLMVAELHFLNVQTASREMFGKGFYSLGVAERAAVEQTALQGIAANYQAITLEFLTRQEAQQPMGFRVPNAGQSEGKP